MRAGKLRYRVSIMEPVETQNEYGEAITTWNALAVVWASKEDLAGREYFAAQQTESEVTTRFRMRYHAGLTSKMRLTLSGTDYDIQSIADPDGRTRELVIMARAV